MNGPYKYKLAVVAICLAAGATSPSSGQLQVAEILPDPAQAGSQFGFSTSIDGGLAVVGGPEFGDPGANATGRVYFYAQDNVDPTLWTQDGPIVALDEAIQFDRFGLAVSISGSFAIIGAPGRDPAGPLPETGAAYIYERIGTTWVQRQELTPNQAPVPVSAQFGESVSIDGTTAVVGYPTDDDVPFGGPQHHGSVHIFEKQGSTWVHQLELTSSDPIANGRFGSAIAIDGDFLIVGADGESKVYIYYRASGNQWTFAESISAPQSGGLFGSSVAITDNAQGDDFAIVGNTRLPTLSRARGRPTSSGGPGRIHKTGTMSSL